MRKAVVLLFLTLLLISCSGNDSRNKVSILFSNLEKADSLCKAGDSLEAEACLEDVINVQIQVDYPSTFKKLIGLLFSQSDSNKQEGMNYYEYMFLCLAKLDALERLYAIKEEPEEKISVLKRLFDLFPDINEIVDKFTEWELQTGGRSSWAASSSYRNRYDNYVDKVQPFNKFSGITKELPKYLFRRKWSYMDKLIIDSDKEYGYNTTFDYFDSILVTHGASLEDYTKVLVKSYMSFSGESKYYYESGMDYQIFKNIIENQDNWFTIWIQHPDIDFLGGERILNSHNEGFVVEYDNWFIYNPSLNKYMESYGLDSHKITTINGAKQMTIELSKGHKYAISTIIINLDKPLLCTLLYKHGHADMVPMIIKAKQYKIQDILVREGYEDGNKKKIYYDNDLNLIEWRLYSEQDVPLCDSTGTHIYRVCEYNDSTIYCYYGNDSLPRKNNYARMKKENETYFYYDWQNNLLKKISGDTCEYYKNLDSILVKRVVNYKTYNTIVTKEHRKSIGPVLFPKPSKEVILYDDIYNYKIDFQYGNIVEIHRFYQDGSYYDGSDNWAMEKFGYDADGKIETHTFFDDKMTFQGGKKYVYKFNAVEIQYYDKNNKLTKTEVTHL